MNRAPRLSRPDRRPSRWLATGAITLALVAAGCADDSADDASDDDRPATTASSNASFCDAVVDADVAVAAAQSQDGPPDEAAVNEAKAAVQAVATDAPAEIADAVDVMVEEGLAMFESETGEPGPGFDAAAETTYGWVGDNCGFDAVDVVAKDYSYTGMPDELAEGAAVVSLTNEGTEFHEMLFVRVNDDTTETTDELLALPEEEAMAKTSMQGGVFALPGATGRSTVKLPAGRYLVICAIPLGLTPEAASSGSIPDGPPHFTQGMVHEITIA